MSALDQKALEADKEPAVLEDEDGIIDRSSFYGMRSMSLAFEDWRRMAAVMDEKEHDAWLGTLPAEQPIAVQPAGKWIPWHRQLRGFSLTSWYFKMCDSPTFWRICPWVFVIIVNGTANFFCLLYCVKYFAFNETVMMGWLYQFLTAFVFGLLIVHTLVVIVKNNMAWTRKIMKTKRYQMIEKLVVTPLLPVFRALCLRFCGVDIMDVAD